MFCQNCGTSIPNGFNMCLQCGCPVFVPPPKYYRSSFVLGVLSLCLPLYGTILGIIGLPLACICRRKSAIVMNSIGVVLWPLLYGTLFVILKSLHLGF